MYHACAAVVFYAHDLFAATCLNGHYASESSFKPEKAVQKLIVPSEFATLVTMTKISTSDNMIVLAPLSSFLQKMYACLHGLRSP